MRIYEGSPRQDFEEVLRSIGAFLDQRGMRDVLLLEAPDGFIVQGLVTTSGSTGTWSEAIARDEGDADVPRRRHRSWASLARQGADRQRGRRRPTATRPRSGSSGAISMSSGRMTSSSSRARSSSASSSPPRPESITRSSSSRRRRCPAHRRRPDEPPARQASGASATRCPDPDLPQRRPSMKILKPIAIALSVLPPPSSSCRCRARRALRLAEADRGIDESPRARRRSPVGGTCPTTLADGWRRSRPPGPLRLADQCIRRQASREDVYDRVHRPGIMGRPMASTCFVRGIG
jgi:hypothetical protein